MVKLAKSSKGIGGGRRRYWADSARMLGMVDTDRGIQFKKEVKNPEVHVDLSFDRDCSNSTSSTSSCSYSGTTRSDQRISSGNTGSSSDATKNLVCNGNGNAKNVNEASKKRPRELKQLSTTKPASSSSSFSPAGIQLVTSKERSKVTEYLFLLVSQMEGCVFTEDDRTGGRSKVKTNKIGFPGIQCKHCFGKAGYGRYFPTSVSSLNLANSDRNMYNHLMKCRKCPSSVKDQLKKLKMRKCNGEQKIERGGRKDFFMRVWERLHGTGTTTGVDSPTPTVAAAMTYEHHELDVSPSLSTSGPISSTLRTEVKVNKEEEGNQPTLMVQL